jgi:hypothetical protein
LGGCFLGWGFYFFSGEARTAEGGNLIGTKQLLYDIQFKKGDDGIEVLCCSTDRYGRPGEFFIEGPGWKKYEAWPVFGNIFHDATRDLTECY